ncbi:hypothetical protein, partial [Pantoea sp. UBA6567]|uniref:hypothetical protein n=1 Tax=Pantoea sp. UBA6567 TaxID=1947043 RepID=UPI00259A1A4F
RIRSCSARALAGVLPARPGRHSAPGAADGASLPACKFFILFFLKVLRCGLKLLHETFSHKKRKKREKTSSGGKRHPAPPREGTVPG